MFLWRAARANRHTRARARILSLSFFLVDREEWRVNPIAGLSEMIPVHTCGEYNVTYYGRPGLAPRLPRDRPCAVRRMCVTSRTDFDGKQNGPHAGRDRTRYGRTAKMARNAQYSHRRRTASAGHMPACCPPETQSFFYSFLKQIYVDFTSTCDTSFLFRNRKQTYNRCSKLQGINIVVFFLY